MRVTCVYHTGVVEGCPEALVVVTVVTIERDVTAMDVKITTKLGHQVIAPVRKALATIASVERVDT